MRFGAVATERAVGAILAHSVDVGARRLAKGTRLTPADVAAARDAGIEALTVAVLDPDDVPEDDAARAVGEAACGEGLAAESPAHGRVNLAATADGLVIVDRAMVDALNAVDEAVTLATERPFARVGRGDFVATIKIIPFAAPKASVVRCADIARAAPLRLAPFGRKRVRLLQTVLPGTPAKLLDKTATVTRARVEALGLAAWSEARVPHDAVALVAALAEPADIVLIAGASAIADRRDVIPAAIVAAGGEVVRLGMPVEPGNLICVGRIGGMPVIGLPGCARSPKRNGFDWVLERLHAGIDVAAGDIAAMGVGGLLADVPRPEPRPARRGGTGTVGGIVLAGGRSVRMGTNKLTTELGGKPVLAHVLDTLGDAGLPAIVVTGHEAERVEAIAGGVTTVRAERYAEGLSQTLAAGIKAVPRDWSAALVLLGDMPAVSADDIRAVAAAARDDCIVVPAHHGKRGNPVAWGRRFFPRLAAIEGDVGGKALMAEFADAIVEIAASAGVLIDVDTPEALAAVRARQSS